MNFAYSVLVHVVWFLSTYFVVLTLLMLFSKRKQLHQEPQDRALDDTIVSIVVPAYNEEETIADCINSLLAIDFERKRYEIIIVNDGSNDNTSKIAKAFEQKMQVRLLDNMPNKGKAACLNQGIRIAQGNIIACMDADTIVPKDILRKLLPYFADEKVGSVTVSVEVRHVKNFLQRIIQLEYALGLSLFLKLLTFVNCVHVTPGPFSMYRASVLRNIGGFDEKNMTEDLEIAYRIHKAHYHIENCMTTAVKTITPDTMISLYRQRRRWYVGALLTAWKHKDMMLSRKSGMFGFFIPFNFALITLGMIVFFFSVYLGVSNFANALSFYSLIGYDFFNHFNWDFDVLTLNSLLFLGLTGIAGMILVVTCGVRAVRRNSHGILVKYLGYFLLFFIYQAFWLAAYSIVATRRKIQW